MDKKQRLNLRSLGQKLQDLVFIGKDGLTENVLNQINDNLYAHELIKIKVQQTVSDEILAYAASLAVKYSEVKNSSKVEVDYCLVKYVHKEVGSKPGMVVYTDYHTIII